LKNYMMKKTGFFAVAIAAVMLATGLFFYAGLPDPLPSHWNAAGEVNGYLPKNLIVYGVPIATALLGLLLVYLPQIDPLKKNVDKFRKEYDLFTAFFTAFIAFLYGITLAWGLGYEFPMNYAVLPAVAAVLYLSGSLMQKSKRNWFIGVKNPWTLSSDRVWGKTHGLASKMFKGFAFAFLALAFYPQATVFVVAALIGGIVVITAYSYFAYKEELK
jgi:uncharacterized membrane protein